MIADIIVESPVTVESAPSIAVNPLSFANCTSYDAALVTLVQLRVRVRYWPLAPFEGDSSTGADAGADVGTEVTFELLEQWDNSSGRTMAHKANFL
jgi:hypothetical protein